MTKMQMIPVKYTHIFWVTQTHNMLVEVSELYVKILPPDSREGGVSERRVGPTQQHRPKPWSDIWGKTNLSYLVYELFYSLSL